MASSLNMKKILFLIFYIIVNFTYSSAMSAEEAKFDIIKSNEIYEIRKYSNRIAVEVVMKNQNNSFRKLFNYISGNNKNNEEIKMTTPVTQIEKEGNLTMQFYLPSKFNEEDVPNPLNSDVKIVVIEGGYYAVIRYSGRASDSNFIKHKALLEDKLKKNNIKKLSPPIRATYNRPFTLPQLRRNEVMYKVEWK